MNTKDTQHTHFWDAIPFLKPYALLARWDRPIGFWLLYWPCAWGLALAPTFQTLPGLRQIGILLLFLIGAIVMRGAGCTINDILDRKLDAQVDRTKNRPLANGSLSLRKAILFLLLQLGIGAVILLQLSPVAIIIGLIMLPLIATYPLMKRITWWPQLFLGLNFNSGALIGWAALEGSLSWPPIILYIAGICWTIAYDTVYAHMDADDDMMVGIKSTALLFGPRSKTITGLFFIAAFVLFAIVLHLTNAPSFAFVVFGFAAFIESIAYRLWPPSSTAYSLRFFRFQHPVGLVLALACLAATLVPVLF